jgi:hypothetical protein
VWVHTAAYIHNDEIIHSRIHGNSTSRESFYVVVPHNGRQRIAEVAYFVRLQRPGKDNPLRLAVCDLFKQHSPWSDPDIGTLLRARVYPGDPDATFEKRNWGIGLRAIETKVMAADSVSERQQPHMMYFQTTSMASALH